jgi:hypothetical protein
MRRVACSITARTLARVPPGRPAVQAAGNLAALILGRDSRARTGHRTARCRRGVPRPAACRRLARGSHPRGMSGRLGDRRVLPDGPELPAGPDTGNAGPPLHRAVPVEAACHGIKVGICHPDRPPPYVPDPVLQASRPRSETPAGTSHPKSFRTRRPVAAARSFFTHHEPADIHMARQSRRARVPAASTERPFACGTNFELCTRVTRQIGGRVCVPQSAGHES